MARCQSQLRGAAVVESQRGDGHPLFITKPNNPQQNWSGLVWPNGWGMDGMVRGARGEGFWGWGDGRFEGFFGGGLVGFFRGAERG